MNTIRDFMAHDALDRAIQRRNPLERLHRDPDMDRRLWQSIARTEMACGNREDAELYLEVGREREESR